MTYNVRLTCDAKENIESLSHYISVVLQSPENARGVVAKLRQEIASLDTMSNRYRLFDSGSPTFAGVRVMPVGNYRVLYECDDRSETVKILRIYYKRQQIN